MNTFNVGVISESRQTPDSRESEFPPTVDDILLILILAIAYVKNTKNS